jgi:hypothetical protein
LRLEEEGLQWECLSVLTFQEQHGCDVTVGWPPLELGESWGTSCLVCCYGSPASHAGRSWRMVPLSCLKDFSFNCGIGRQGSYGCSIGVTWAHQDWGIPFFMANLSYHAPRILLSTGLSAI